MSEKQVKVWGIHGGKTGGADTLFLKKNCVALGWVKIGDLSQLQADRESFKHKMKQAYPDKKPGAIPVDAGQLFRPVHLLAEKKYNSSSQYPMAKCRA